MSRSSANRRLDRLEKKQKDDARKREIYDRKVGEIVESYEEGIITLRQHDEKIEELIEKYSDDEMVHGIDDFSDTERLDWMVKNMARAGDSTLFIDDCVYFGFVVECVDGRRSTTAYIGARAAIDEAMRGNLTEIADDDGEDAFPF